MSLIEHWPDEKVWVKTQGRRERAAYPAFVVQHPAPHGEGWVEVVPADQLRGAVEALKFYADPKTWDTISPRGTVSTDTIAKRDNGERARRALGGQ